MMDQLEKLLEICEEQESCLQEIRRSKFYKLAYLANRFSCEFLRGNWANKKNFVKWLTNRAKIGGAVSQYHYVWRMTSAAGELRRLIELDDGYEEVYFNKKRLGKQSKAMEDIIDSYKGDRVAIFAGVIDWNTPMFQRPQQIPLAFSKQNILSFYLTPNVSGKEAAIQKINPFCYVLPNDYFADIVFLSKMKHCKIILDIYSNDIEHSVNWINKWRKHLDAVVYEYIDDLCDDIMGKVPEIAQERLEVFSADPEIYVVATADELYRKITEKRETAERVLWSGNGADEDHFARKFDQSIKLNGQVNKAVALGKPIIGYYGAIAPWFDFDLFEYAAQQRPDYTFLLIGPKYGDSQMEGYERIKKLPNVIMAGVVDYKELPENAIHFDVAMIPFLVNEVTQATSPIKLFEYMILRKPIVTTAMSECRKYDVVSVANNREEFVVMLDEAIQKKNDPQWISKLYETGHRNSWEEKAKEILTFLGWNV